MGPLAERDKKETSMLMTECECPQPGYCQRHKCHKSKLFWYVCRTVPSRFQAWEKGRGPGQRTQLRPKSLPPCRHRGREPIDRIECETCQAGKVKAFVFACVLFGECTIRRVGNRTRRAREMAACRDCPEYVPLDLESEAEPGFESQSD